MNKIISFVPFNCFRHIYLNKNLGNEFQIFIIIDFITRNSMEKNVGKEDDSAANGGKTFLGDEGNIFPV